MRARYSERASWTKTGLDMGLKGFGKVGFSETVFQVGTQYRQRLSQLHT